MRHDPKKFHEDILRAIDEVCSFCQHKTFEDFPEDRALQRVIKKEPEILGKRQLT